MLAFIAKPKAAQDIKSHSLRRMLVIFLTSSGPILR